MNILLDIDKATTLCDVCDQECKMNDGVLNCADFSLLLKRDDEETCYRCDGEGYIYSADWQEYNSKLDEIEKIMRGKCKKEGISFSHVEYWNRIESLNIIPPNTQEEMVCPVCSGDGTI